MDTLPLMETTNAKKNEKVDLECKEELIDIKKKFISHESDYIKDSKKYLYDELSYINRINTFKMWVKKPAHLSSLILARNGYICINENTIKCEMCNCKYIYEKYTYSIYTKINDLCVLHLDNCPWKNKLMDLSIFKLDEKSLSRKEIIQEYDNNVSMLENALYEIPLINIKKTINDLIVIIKKHMENNFSKKKYSIFNWYINFFKNQFSQIFLNNKTVIEKGIEKIKMHYKDYEKYIIDMDYINNLNFNISNQYNYINILSNHSLSLTDEKEDLQMYLKLVDKMKDYDYEHINIYKIITMCGWFYKGDAVDSDNNFTQVLYCKYCYREIKISNYSAFSIRDNKFLLFKEFKLHNSKHVMDDLIKKKKKMIKMQSLSNHIDNDMRNILESMYALLNKKNVHTGNNQGNVDTSNVANSNLSNHDDDNNDNLLKNKQKPFGDASTWIERKSLDNSNNNNTINEEEFSYKWKNKNIILTKKNNDIFKHKSNNAFFCNTNRRNFPTNRNENLFSKKNLDIKEHSIKNSMSKTFLEISDYIKNEKFFIKTLYDYYILADSEFLNSNEISNENKNTNFYNIRLFDVIENHRVHCPYVTEDLYYFSKITKLFFELLLSEFQRKFAFK